MQQALNPVLAFNPFAPGSATTLILVATRVSGLVMVAPVFSAKTVPMTVRTGLVILLSLLVQPAALADRVADPILAPSSIASEAVIGIAMGLGAALIVGAAEAAGELLSIQIGLSGEALLDPLTASQSTSLGQFMSLFATTVLLTLGLHLVMIDALASSVHTLPIGAALNTSAGLASLVGSGAKIFALGVQFAAPVIAAVLVANVALAVLGRAAPQIQILTVSFPIQITVGLFALAAALPFLAAWLGGWRMTYDGILEGAFRAMIRR